MTTMSDSIPSRSARLRTPSAWPAVALTVDTLLSCCAHPPTRWVDAPVARSPHIRSAPRKWRTEYCEDTASSAQKGAGTLVNHVLGHEQVPGRGPERQIRVDRRYPPGR